MLSRLAIAMIHNVRRSCETREGNHAIEQHECVVGRTLRGRRRGVEAGKDLALEDGQDETLCEARVEPLLGCLLPHQHHLHPHTLPMVRHHSSTHTQPSVRHHQSIKSPPRVRQNCTGPAFANERNQGQPRLGRLLLSVTDSSSQARRAQTPPNDGRLFRLSRYTNSPTESCVVGLSCWAPNSI